MSNWIKRNSILRKSLVLPRQIPRGVIRLTSKSVDYESSPPVLANSFPKSGTHLLLQILEALPGVNNYGTFIASTPSITFRERSRSAHIRLLKNMVPAEVLPAHLFYHPSYAETLNQKNCVHFFIYRDPRDVVIAEVHYLTEMNRWHRLHNYFSKKLNSFEDRVSTAILGIQDPDFSVIYPDICSRFDKYRGWLACPDVYSVRYEDLIGINRLSTLKLMAEFYNSRVGNNKSIEQLMDAFTGSIKPEKSHTFRKGESGGWRRLFTQTHISFMKQVAGELLIELGYEEDLNW